MNQKYPYPISYPEFLPDNKATAQRAVNLLDEFHENPKEADLDTFLRGWFAIHFLALAPHPDDIDDWPANLQPFATEAHRRQADGSLSDDQLYCSSASHEGQRLQLDGNLRCYAVATYRERTGYLSARFDHQTGNQPLLTGNKAHAYLYDSPYEAWKWCRPLGLDDVKIYASTPEEDLDCPAQVIVSMPSLIEKQVVIQTPEGKFLYRDGMTFGDDPVRACKYRLYADNVEQQLKQVKAEHGVVWRWVPYPLPDR